LKFWKMNGAGNDFIVLNNLEEHLPVELLPQIARTLIGRNIAYDIIGQPQLDKLDK